MLNKQNYIHRILQIIFFSAILIMSLYLNYHQVFAEAIDHTTVQSFGSDTIPHIEYAKEYFNNQRYIPHPLWHILIKATSYTLHISMEYSAIIVSSFLLLIWALLIYYTAQKLLNQQNNYSYIKYELLLLLITFSIFTVGPLIYPPYSHLIYKGVGSPNIWHNVTLWTVKPFALLSMLFTIWGLQKKKISYYIIAIISVILSIFAKPSFILIFLPSIILLVIDRKYITKSQIYFLLSIIFISVAILLYQYSHTYGNSSKGGIIIDILGVWSNHGSTNIPLAIFLALAFPIIFYILYPKSSDNDFILLSWLQVFFGIILYAVFAEKGAHYSHGNFGWSYRIALSMIYLFTIIEFVKVFFDISIWKRIILLTILFIQVYIGIYYLVHILQGQNPIYIGIFL